MDDDLLIDLVEGYPILYDKKYKGYQHHANKNKAWLRIAENMETDVNTVQRRWGNFRERYSKEIRMPMQQQPCGSDSDALRRKKWVYLDRLSFLKDHIIQRPMRRGRIIDNTISSQNKSATKAPYTDHQYSSGYDPLELMEPETKIAKMEPKNSPLSESLVSNIEPYAHSSSSSSRSSHPIDQSPDVTQSPPGVNSPPSSNFQESNYQQKSDCGEMDDDLLIDLVEKYPILYDKQYISYQYHGKKLKAWQRIAEKMGVDVSSCQRRWGNFRERFSKELRIWEQEQQQKQQGNSDNNTSRRKIWGYLGRLTFLKDHIIQRPMRRRANYKMKPSQPKNITTTNITELPEADLESSSGFYPIELMEPETRIEKFEPRTSPTRETYVVNHLEPLSSHSSSSNQSSHSSQQSPDVTQSPSRIISSSPVVIPTPSSKYHKSKHKRNSFELVDFEEVDKSVIEAAKLFKNICEQKARSPVMDPHISGFTTMIGGALLKLKTKRRMTVIQRCTEIVMQAVIEEEDDED